METYQDRNGNSGVRAFEILDDGIIVAFKNHSQYLYNDIRPGRYQVDQMVRLARQGAGLNAYIRRNVNENYFRRLK